MDLQLPLTQEEINNLKAGDIVHLSGTIYTARDAAHKRMYDTISKGEPLSFDLNNACIYYAGPSPAKPGEIIGSCGPTTSGRMDKYTPTLLQHGLKCMIGKGLRSKEVVESIVSNKCVYFGAIGGAGALISKSVKSMQVIDYEDLGTEAVRQLQVENLPLYVIIDSEGNSLYENTEK